MRLVARNHVSSMVYRAVQKIVHNNGRNSLVLLPDFSNSIDPHVKCRKQIRRLRVLCLNHDPKVVDALEEKFVVNHSDEWLVWAHDNFGSWFLYYFHHLDWSRLAVDRPYPQNSAQARIVHYELDY